MKIIEEINKQREANRLLKQAVQAHVGKIRHLAQAQYEAAKKAGKSVPQSMGSAFPPPPSGAAFPEKSADGLNGTSKNCEVVDPLFILEKNRLRIAALRAAIVELESRVNMQKSYSREVLPPMDGVLLSNDNQSSEEPMMV